MTRCPLDDAAATQKTPGRVPMNGGVVFRVSLLTALGILPVFLFGALTVLIRRDLQFSEAQLGICVAAFFGAASAVSALMGRLVERLPQKLPMMLGAGTTAVALLGVATSQSWQQLAAWLVLAGMGNSCSQVAANLVLSRAVPRGRQGVAFGLKQAAVPGATMLAGIAVPTLGVGLGWRWVMVISGGLALAAATVAPRVMPLASRGRGPGGAEGVLEVRPLVILAFAGGLAAATGANIGAFFVQFAVSRGLSVGVAGSVLAVASLLGMGTRLLVGWIADRRGGSHLGFVTGMIFFGGTGFLALPLVGGDAVPLAAALIVAYGAGWGWPGLFHLAVVHLQPLTPAAATGITQTGVYLGAVIGPLAFGLTVDHLSYTAAWLVSSAGLLISAFLMLWGRNAAAKVDLL